MAYFFYKIKLEEGSVKDKDSSNFFVLVTLGLMYKWNVYESHNFKNLLTGGIILLPRKKQSHISMPWMFLIIK